jgi:predicted DNA-binding transcriptional regulator AlpA
MTDIAIIDSLKRKPLLKEHEVAELLVLKVATLRKWRKLGTGPIYLKLGGAIRYEQESVKAFLDKCRNKTDEDQKMRRVKHAGR